MSNDKSQVQSIVTEPVRVCFPNFFKPRPKSDDNPALVYDAVLLIPPDVSVQPFLQLIRDAMTAKWGQPIKVAPKYAAIHKCDDDETFSEHVGWRFLRVSSKFQPAVVDRAKVEILDPNVIYSGCWCRFQIHAYAFDNKFGKGVSFGLDAVQFVKDGDRLDRRRSVDAFTALDDVADVTEDDLLG